MPTKRTPEEVVRELLAEARWRLTEPDDFDITAAAQRELGERSPPHKEVLALVRDLRKPKALTEATLRDPLARSRLLKSGHVVHWLELVPASVLSPMAVDIGFCNFANGGMWNGRVRYPLRTEETTIGRGDELSYEDAKAAVLAWGLP